ncbi:MAG: hypothetical protein JXB48_19960 [Candidatus Latescibacteria bacterium]|nr:hypothetical protein [Candidatus Latescibacterota bacterium]
MSDEKANIFKVRYLYGRHGRICGRHKREDGAHYPGRSPCLSPTMVSRTDYDDGNVTGRTWRSQPKP